VKYETILLFRKRNRNFESCNKVSSRRWINAIVLKFQAMAHLGNKYPRRLLAGKWEVRYCSRPFLNHSFPAEKTQLYIFFTLSGCSITTGSFMNIFCHSLKMEKSSWLHVKKWPQKLYPAFWTIGQGLSSTCAKTYYPRTNYIHDPPFQRLVL
jgi:hypothetical protein